MIEHLETLHTLARVGTMTEAATELRVSQSTVSKRIAALEIELGADLVEPEGRRVSLTPFAVALVGRTEGILADLREALRHEGGELSGTIRLGISESILASWGAPILAQIRADLPHVTLEIGAHRSPVALDRVRSGEYQLALIAGVAQRLPELVVSRLWQEPMAIVARDARPLRWNDVEVLTIEPGSATWSFLAPQVRALGRRSGVTLKVTSTVQSFPGIVRLAQSGYAHGLVPRALAESMGVPASRIHALPEPGLRRPVHVVTRRRARQRPLVRELVGKIRELAPSDA